MFASQEYMVTARDQDGTILTRIHSHRDLAGATDTAIRLLCLNGRAYSAQVYTYESATSDYLAVPLVHLDWWQLEHMTSTG